MKISKPVERNAGIDLLKILAMFMVIILHIVGKGNILGTVSMDTTPPQFFTAWLLKLLAYCAVNSFAIATGFLMVGRKIKYRRIVELWLIVEFYNIAFLILDVVILKNGISESSLFTLFPVITDQFWYFTAYFCLFFFIPFFNQLIETIPKKALYLLLATGFVLLSLPTVLARFDALHLNYGYSTWWLMYLYFVGAAIKKYGLFSKISAGGALLGYLLAIGITYAVYCLIAGMPDGGILNALITRTGFALDNYSSPTILAAGICLLLFCTKLRIPPRPASVMSKLQPFVFQIYIIHLHDMMWRTVFKSGFSRYAELSPLWLALCTLGTAAAIFIGCLLIDVLRHLLFTLLRIKPILNTVADTLSAKWKASSCRRRLIALFEDHIGI